MIETGGTLDVDLYSYFYGLVRQIPRGMVSTYGDLARALGDIAASRACGYMLSINPDPEGTPCYKVVRSDGTVGKYTHILGEVEKIRRLERDGVTVEGDSVNNFEQIRFKDFETDFPLNSLRSEQERVASMVDLNDDFVASRVAAVDVSYDDEVHIESILSFCHVSSMAFVIISEFHFGLWYNREPVRHYSGNLFTGQQRGKLSSLVPNVS